ncbi:MAG: L-seryl-tRNA(Sec) selenium transferase [Candidatus Eremiobacteraeota bacterium]|nr:L-seryl-tRNA(Sec) selenium transferase [Candidatus Eremiobacteraeota bacterium]
MSQTLRGIPAVHRFLADPRIARYEFTLGRDTVKRAIDVELDRARASAVSEGYEELAVRLSRRLENERMQTLLETVNGTGVLLHTNLGRAPLMGSALQAAVNIGGGYSNLEYQLDGGVRGSRYARLTPLLRSVTGAEDAVVVNNCAAAVLLILDTFAKGREVIVARNQLIEIGGGFRLPDVLERSGAKLVEVGATNKVYLSDYERALSPRTALLMRSHTSNYRITGFTHDVTAYDLSSLAKRTSVPFVEDLGSGALVNLEEYGLPHERTVQEAVRDGVDLIAFSGDKLLGGPQAGIIVGATAYVARLRANPLIRALRVDKLTIASLGETLQAYVSAERREEIPLFRMLAASVDDLRARGRVYVETLSATVARLADTLSFVGGGSLPETSLPSVGVVLHAALDANEISRRLRHGEPAILGRVDDDAFLLDLRSISPEQDAAVIAAIRRAL